MAEQHEKTLVPQIRFAGFTDPWEQRKLGEVASKRIEKNTNGIKETFTNSAEHGIVSQLDYFDHDITNDANIGNYSVVYPDDFVYNPRISAIAPCGPINRNKLGRNGVMSPLYTVFSVDDMINKLYLEHYFTTNRWHQFMFLEGNSGARSDRFSISDSTFFEMPIQCPVLEEQELIALFFDRLDSLITLHQRKYDKLCVLKKSMLDKMFPKGGSLYPEIRFAGFTDPWEQRKLGDVATIVGGGTPSTNNDAYWDGDIDWYSPAELGEQVYADRSVRRITQAGYDSCSATLLPAGKTILFTSRAGIGNTAILRRSACTNQGFQSLVVNDDTDVYFVYSMTDRIKNFAEQKASGSTFLEISGKGLAAGEFAFPSKDEQTAIGSMFKQLDHLITLHQRKYDGCANPLFSERRISCRKPSHQNRCSATTTPSG